MFKKASDCEGNDLFTLQVKIILYAHTVSCKMILLLTRNITQTIYLFSEFMRSLILRIYISGDCLFVC
ncbi:hypothetical protein D6Z18_10270 [Escherichia coli]|nr:hypothetical protein [Escherichia coli]